MKNLIIGMMSAFTALINIINVCIRKTNGDKYDVWIVMVICNIIVSIICFAQYFTM